MLVIMEQWDEAGCHTNNTYKYLLLMISKLGLDALVFYFCCQKVYTFFLNMCSLALLLVDVLMVLIMATVWFLGPDKSPLSPCFVLTNASATYGALPLPMMILGLLNYSLEDASPNNHSSFCKLVRNAVLTLLVLILAATFTFGSGKVELKDQRIGTWTVMFVCRLSDCSVITYFVLGLFIAVICTLLPFCSMIPRWVKESNKISLARDEDHKKRRSDLMSTQTKSVYTKSAEENYLEDSDWQRPPLWLSLTLGFGLFWMPYLVVSVGCWLIGLVVPAYLTVNILWLECVNSLIVGVVFWVKSKTQGPYSNLPGNVCSWQVFWHLSKGTQQLQPPHACV
ncbi:putative G-protein coupled receptor 160 [Halichoeres trimaculatus]|uniref:putative G-protein coupled receptor 160 n=1 Tax=Halichoeres trimaculatus TaxID=147232 RepID=UPI003D9DBF57